MQKLEEIYREIGELEKTEIETQVHVDYSERFAHFLWAGLLFLLAEILLANTRFRSIPWGCNRAFCKPPTLLVAAAATPVEPIFFLGYGASAPGAGELCQPYLGG